MFKIIYTIPLFFEKGDIKVEINPVLIEDKDKMYLVDAGYPGFLQDIEKFFAQNGLNMSDLTGVIITHQDHDHMGASAELEKKYPAVTIYSSEKELPYVLGKEKSLRLCQAEEQQFEQAFIDTLKAVPHPVDAVAITPDSFSGTAIEIIETPGHTPGPISVYIGSEKTLISGDLLVVKDGKLCIANEIFALDKPTIIESIKKLLDYNIDTIICYHGGIYKSANIKNELQEIIKKGYNKL